MTTYDDCREIEDGEEEGEDHGLDGVVLDEGLHWEN